MESKAAPTQFKHPRLETVHGKHAGNAQSWSNTTTYTHAHTQYQGQHSSTLKLTVTTHLQITNHHVKAINT